jgi:serine/threonine protein kinase
MLLPEWADKFGEAQLIGEGSFGKIYKAKEMSTNRCVIIKRILNDNIWKYLCKMRKCLLDFSCEQIVKIYDIVSINGANFIIEQYVEGIPIKNPGKGFGYYTRYPGSFDSDGGVFPGTAAAKVFLGYNNIPFTYFRRESGVGIFHAVLC